jgi:hypothetical protein
MTPCHLIRTLVLSLCLVVFATPAAGAPFELVDIALTSGQTNRPMRISSGGSATLTLGGDQFALAVSLSPIGGFFQPSTDLIPGTAVTVNAGWVGDDATGGFTYQGQTRSLGTGHPGDPGLDVQFRSQPFVVAPLDGSPVVTVPFTVTAGIFATPTNPPFDLHGTGTMTFTLLDAIPDRPSGPVWASGAAQWFVTTPEPLVATPEPPTILLAVTGIALVLAGRSLWRRR